VGTGAAISVSTGLSLGNETDILIYTTTYLNTKCDYSLNNIVPLKGGDTFRLSEYVQTECDRLGITDEVIHELILKGTQTSICGGLATSYCFCLGDHDFEPRWAGLTIVITKQTDTIVSVFFLRY